MLLSVGEYAFAGCTGLTKLNLPQTLREIQQCAFLDCENLLSCLILSNVTTIGADAFSHCADYFTIIGEENSYAQTYAEENTIPFAVATVPVGDINNDYIVTVADAILLNRLIAEDATLDVATLNLNTVDCNTDGLVNLSDALWILQQLAGV